MELVTNKVIATKFVVGKIYVGTSPFGAKESMRYYFKSIKSTGKTMTFQFLGTQKEYSPRDKYCIEIEGDKKTFRRKIHHHVIRYSTSGTEYFPGSGVLCMTDDHSESCYVTAQGNYNFDTDGAEPRTFRIELLSDWCL